MNMRPTVVEYVRGLLLPMEAQLRAERGASDRHNWLPRAIQYCGTPAPGVSLFVLSYLKGRDRLLIR